MPEVPALVLLHRLSKMAKRPLGLWADRTVIKEGVEYLRVLKQAGVPWLEGWLPLCAHGAESLERVTVARHDGSG